VIEGRNLGKRFGRRAAIRDVSLRVDRGEVVGFLGPNGAGKTTTLRILAGVFPPSSGHALVDGLDLALLSADGRTAAGRALADKLLEPLPFADGHAVLTLRGRLLADALVRELTD